jgi:chromosome segregation ATPase
MLETVVVAVAFFALGFTLLSLRRAQEKVGSLESDLDAVEGHNRTLQEQRDTLKSTLTETTTAHEVAKKRLETSETERAAAVETATRLEKLRGELEGELARVHREQESLERRVVDFQGQWSHQLNTLEAEISTVVRQLGEFRKGTQLPIPRGEGNPAASQSSGTTESGLSAPLGPRLARSPSR